MTNEQVIKRINEIREILADYRELTSYDHEALDIAISALSKQSASSGQVDHIAESDKMIKLEKRTITERLIIAESLIDSVIADSDQFRDTTKKTDDFPDIHVGKTDLLEKLTRYEDKFERHYDHTDCIWYHYLEEDEPNACPSTCSQYRDGWNDAMDYIFRNGKGYQPYKRKAK